MTAQITRGLDTYLNVPRAIDAINRDRTQARVLATSRGVSAAARILRASGNIPTAAQAIAQLNTERTQARNRLATAGITTR